MPPYGITPAEVISRGTPGILSALQSKGQALGNLGAGIGGAAGSIGVGIFKMARVAKEEKEIALIDDAIKGATALGDPGAMADVLGKLQGTLKTNPGRKYLLDNIERFRGAARDVLQDEATKALTQERKNRAASELTPDQLKQDRVAKAQKLERVSAARKELGSLLQQDQKFSQHPQLATQLLTKQGHSFEDIQDAMKEDPGIWVMPDEAAKAEAAAKKVGRKTMWDTARAQELIPIEDEEGNVSYLPDPKGKRANEAADARKKKDAAFYEDRGRRRRLEDEANEEKTEAGQRTRISKAASLASAALRGLVDQDGEPINEEDAPRVKELQDDLVDYARFLQKDVRELMAGGIGAEAPAASPVQPLVTGGDDKAFVESMKAKRASGGEFTDEERARLKAINGR